MKLLFDQNLSYRLVARLAAEFPESVHVRDAGLARTPKPDTSDSYRARFLNQLLFCLRQIEASDETVAVTKKGIPAAVILSMERFQGLLETLEILSDESAMQSLRTSIRQSRNKKWVSYAEVFGH